MEIDEDAFFVDDGDGDPSAEAPPEDLWAFDVVKPKGDISLAENVPHEWDLVMNGAMRVFECRRCGMKVSCLKYENPDVAPEEDQFPCTEMLLRGILEK